MKLKTDNIFIDTSIYYKENFAFEKYNLGTLSSLCEDKLINLILTDITISEVKKHINEQVNCADAAYKKYIAESINRGQRPILFKTFHVICAVFKDGILGPGNGAENDSNG